MKAAESRRRTPCVREFTSLTGDCGRSTRSAGTSCRWWSCIDDVRVPSGVWERAGMAIRRPGG